MHTPPLKEFTADGRPRGLFFDVSSSAVSTPRSTCRGIDSPGPKEWWDVPAKASMGSQLLFPVLPVGLAAAGGGAIDDSNGAETGNGGMIVGRCRKLQIPRAALFEFDVPEHLPSSPMCPANPRNVKSGGKGVCVVSLLSTCVQSSDVDRIANTGEVSWEEKQCGSSSWRLC